MVSHVFTFTARVHLLTSVPVSYLSEFLPQGQNLPKTFWSALFTIPFLGFCISRYSCTSFQVTGSYYIISYSEASSIFLSQDFTHSLRTGCLLHCSTQILHRDCRELVHVTIILVWKTNRLRQHTGARPTDWLSHGGSGLHYISVALRLAFAKTPSPWVKTADI